MKTHAERKEAVQARTKGGRMRSVIRRTGKTLCGLLIGELMGVAEDPEKVDCKNCRRCFGRNKR